MLSSLQQKVSEAEKLLSDLDSLNVKEAKLLTEWKNDIADVKSKLLDLDENLAEQ